MVERIFQILITDGPASESRFSEDLLRNIQSLKALYPDATYARFDNDQIVAFLRQHFPSEVLDAYQKLTPFAFKADLARYCLLHEYGGLYSDLSYLHFRPLPLKKNTDLVVFRDIPGHPAWAVSNSVIYARPKSPVLMRAIQRIVAHHQSRYYGLSPLDPTGPYMFGRALAEEYHWHETLFGDSKLLSQEDNGRANIVKTMPTGEVIAIRNKVNSCSIDELVEGHSNNYVDLWNAKRIWGETGFIQRVGAKFGRPKGAAQ